MLELKKFLDDKCINKYGRYNLTLLSHMKKWPNEIKKYEKAYKINKNKHKFIYHFIWNIKSIPRCKCGAKLKFININKGYSICSKGIGCLLNKRKMRNKSISYENIKNKLEIKHTDKTYDVEIYILIKNIKNNDNIRITKYWNILKQYKKYNIQNWYYRLLKYIKARKNNIILKNDSTSIKFFMIKYGYKGKEIYKIHHKELAESTWKNCLKRNNNNYKDAIEEYNFIQFKKGTSYEAFLYRNKYDVNKAIEEYNKYWNNTTFAISEKRFKNKYGSNWKIKYNERINLHKKIGKEIWIWNENKKCTPKELEDKKIKAYRSASISKKKETVINNLKSKGYSENQIEEYCINRWDTNSLNSNINKYGEIKGTKKYNELIKNLSFRNTLEGKIDKYGEIKGTKKYNDWVKKCTTFGFGIASKESMNIFWPLIDWLFENDYCEFKDIFVGIPESKEYFLNAKKELNKFYLYDFTIPKFNIIIEYNGEKYHPNPKWLKEDFDKWKNWKSIYLYETANEIYTKNLHKINFAKKNDFNVLELWSSDSIEYNLQKCKELIQWNIHKLKK